MPGLTLKIRRRSPNYDTKAVNVLGYTFLFSAGTYSAKAIATGLGIGMFSQAASALVYLGWFVVLLGFIMQNYYIVTRILVTEMAYFAFLFVNISLFPNTGEIYNEYIMFIRQIVVVYIPSGVVCSQITSFSNIFERLRIWGYVGTFMMFLAYILGYAKVHGNQYLGVQISPFVIILFVDFWRRKTVANTVALIVAMLLVLVGDRQSLIVVAVCALVSYIFINKPHKKKIILAGICVIVGLLLFFVFAEDILGFAVSLFEQVGLNTKIFSTLLSGEFLSTQTRDIIYETAFRIIEQKGAVYSGPFSGIYLVREEGGSWMVYPHNIVLELLIDYGTVLGTVICIALILLILRNCLRGSADRRLLITCLSLMTMVRLMVSSSYLIEGNFYVLLMMLLMGRGPQKRKHRFIY